MRVLYLGGAHPSSTSRHRADALRRLGCAVTHLDPQEAIAAQTKGRWLGALHYRTGYSLTRAVVESWLQRQLHGKDRFDLCWVDSGELLGPKAIADLRDRAGYVVLFNHDDPSGPRDRLRFMTLRAAIAQYSLCVVVRDINVAEFQSLGARDVMRV